MRYLEVDGLRVSRIGLGTWQFGSREWGYGEAYAAETAPALLRRALQLGITMIDTAEAYGPGRSERIIGDTLASLDPAERSGVTVATKFMPLLPLEPIVARQAAGSLRRLRTDALDLYYVHWPNPLVSVRRIQQSVRPLLASGVVRRAAVSNHTLGQWREAERALRAPLVANQVRFSLVSPGPARDLVPYAADHDRMVVAYSPLGQGLLAGERDWSTVRGIRSMRRFGPAAARETGGLSGLRTALAEVAAANDATPAQVALAWVLGHPNTVAIPGARTLEQLERNAAAADLVLSDDEHARLTEAAEALARG